MILTLFISCAAPKVVIPELTYQPAAEIERAAISCVPQVNAVEAAFIQGTPLQQESACIELAKCYRTLWKLWEYEYRKLEAQVNTFKDRSP